MKPVKLMLTCLCDAFYGEVGIAAVRVLEHCGCTVDFVAEQTCCGQPPFNAGDWAAARSVARHAQTVLFDGAIPVVTPSGSCAAMLREGYEMLFPEDLPNISFELVEYLVKQLEITSWPHPVSHRKIAFHRSCHGRMIHLGAIHEELVATIPGVELVDFAQAEQCCGFGGAFCATHGKVSAGIGLEKLHNIVDAGAQGIVSGDMGCLMQLQGLVSRHKLPLKISHVAELLAEGLPA